jgi:hypothetical protein
MGDGEGMTPTAERKLLTKWKALGSREVVFHTEEGLEIETTERYEVVHRTVFFEDVLWVTLHRELGGGYLALNAAIALFFLGFGVLFVAISVKAWPVALVFGAVGMPALIAFLLRLLYGLDVITVFSRRSKAIIRFGMKKQRAREVYGLICASVRTAHRKYGDS